MKHVLILILLQFCSNIVIAQNKLDYSARNLPDSLSQTYNVIVTFDGSKIDFGDLKVDIVSEIGNMAVVNAIPALMKKIAELPQVISVSLGEENRMLDVKQSDAQSIATDDEQKSDKKNSNSPIKTFFLKLFKKLGLAK